MSLAWTQSIRLLWSYWAINLCFLGVQWLLLKTYFFVRNKMAGYKESSRLIDNKIGWGDLLFVTALCFFFSPLNFIVFYLGSQSVGRFTGADR